MLEHEDFYTPAHIDEQIDALLQARDVPARDLRLADDLRAILEHENENARSLHTVYQKLMGDTSGQQGATIVSIAKKRRQERPVVMPKSLQKSRTSSSMVRVWSTLAAVLVVAILVGSMLLILNTVHQTKNGSPGAGTPAPALPEGQITYRSGKIYNSTPLSWSPNGKRVAAALHFPTVESWDAQTGKNVVIYPINGDFVISATAWSPNGTLLAVAGDSHIYIFNAQTAQLLRTISPTVALNTSTSPLAAFAGATRSLLSSMIPSSGNGSTPADVAWSPDGKYLSAAILGNLNGIYIWDAQSGSLVKRLTDFDTNYNVRTLWEPHGSLLATIACSANCPSTQAVVLDTTTWKIVRRFADNINVLDWSPNGQQLALADTAKGTVRIVNVRTGQTVKQFTDPQAAHIAGIHWSPDGSRLALETLETLVVHTSAARRISIWSATDGTLLYTFPQKGVYEATWSPDSKYIRCVQTNQTDNNAGMLIWVA